MVVRREDGSGGAEDWIQIKRWAKRYFHMAVSGGMYLELLGMGCSL